MRQPLAAEQIFCACIQVTHLGTVHQLASREHAATGNMHMHRFTRSVTHLGTRLVALHELSHEAAGAGPRQGLHGGYATLCNGRGVVPIRQLDGHLIEVLQPAHGKIPATQQACIELVLGE